MFWALVVLHLVAIGAGIDPLRLATKPLLVPALAACAAARGGPRLLLGALACGWAGDVLLEIGGTVAFLLGMGCFAAGHVCYLRLFAARGALRGARARCAVYAVVWAVLVVLLWPGLDAGLRVPVAVYSLLLTAMAAGAFGLGRTGAAGGLLFLLSDGMIAAGLADWPRPPAHDLWIMLTYAVAQFCLVRAVQTPAEPGVPGNAERDAAAYGGNAPADRPRTPPLTTE
ncbi:lysoplasmalogenase [Streptomyces sp. PLK6-54]|uniref:Lysoplasmalogenase n=1 Tax=Actinacidiphila acidipaludis TaxID=2873382 RepID=A0ABS7QF19_9ACTN|nr:lysoplasmalogenase [Streptomyces acidipaludis]